MPMFEDHVDDEAQEQPSQPIAIPAPSDQPLSRRSSEESIRTELCDGPVPDSPPRTPDRDASAAVSDRAELIQRLKRGESPTWVPNRHVRADIAQPRSRPRANDHKLENLFHRNRRRSTSGSPRPPSAGSPTLLPAADITPEKRELGEDDAEAAERQQEGLNIERPRSALHSGDFTQPRGGHDGRHDRASPEDTSLHADGNAWIATSPPRHYTPFAFERRSLPAGQAFGFKSGTSSLSSSFSSSFFYKPPTSPLVQSESNDDVDLSLPMDNIDITANSPRNPRRHTLTSHNSSPYVPQSLQRHMPGIRREGTYPYQAHQPRRSLTSTPSFALTGSSPQTPAFLRSRRPSIGSDTSPLQHASMVGSYEESILRGRMSTTPSKPLDFLAQIGVLGLGKCKASLRCPAHVTLPFSAVFYSYATTSHGRAGLEDGPSPYVGQVDLENGLANPEEELRAKRKLQSRTLARRARDDDIDMDDGRFEMSDTDIRRAVKQKRRSHSPKAPPGGSYRIPERGQLQIIIKNQNKTAVKLFLVPYDLAGMEPGTKTFIRQRSYSAGPIIDNIPALKGADGGDRPILRYLIHLHICCPARGRYYLYKSIRVVFANRVPDGKEKLRNEVTFPEPRFTPYKPIRVMHPPIGHAGAGGPGAILAAEKAFRRRSSGFTFGRTFEPLAGLAPPPLPTAARPGPPPGGSLSLSDAPVQPIPFHIPPRGRAGGGGGEAAPAPARSPGSSRDRGSPMRDSAGDSVGSYNKLSRGDVGYGGNAFLRLGSSSPGAAEGLLSQRLRSLGVQHQNQQAEDRADGEGGVGNP